MMTQRDILRTVRFRPYRKGAGPVFKLVVWDTFGTIHGKSRLGYRLVMQDYFPDGRRMHPWTIFEGEDFGCSPMHAIDSDETIKAIMGFLTLRPGDTDPDYFADYTPEQLDYCAQHAEALACEVMARFGE